MHVYTNWNSTYVIKQSSQIRWWAQDGFAAFAKGVQMLISGSPFAETEQLSKLKSESGILATS